MEGELASSKEIFASCLMIWRHCGQPSSPLCLGCWTECMIRWVQFWFYSFWNNGVYVPLVLMWKNSVSHGDFSSRLHCFCLAADTFSPCVTDIAPPVCKCVLRLTQTPYTAIVWIWNLSVLASYPVLTKLTSDISRDMGFFHHRNISQTWLSKDLLCPSTRFETRISRSSGNNSWKSGI